MAIKIIFLLLFSTFAYDTPINHIFRQSGKVLKNVFTRSKIFFFSAVEKYGPFENPSSSQMLHFLLCSVHENNETIIIPFHLWQSKWQFNDFTISLMLNVAKNAIKTDITF